MIQFAQKKYSSISNLKFEVRDVEKMSDKEEYDVVFSLFGLHWMNDISNCAKLAFNALKPSGKLLFFVPLEKEDLFVFRKNFIDGSRWKECFDEKAKDIKPFIADKKEYLIAFKKYFECKNEEDYFVKKEYSTEDFVKFLSSWMQEVRHICSDQRYQIKKDVIANAYVTEFIDSIPISTQGNIVKRDAKITFTEHVFCYEGVKNLGSIDTSDFN